MPYIDNNTVENMFNINETTGNLDIAYANHILDMTLKDLKELYNAVYDIPNEDMHAWMISTGIIKADTKF